LIEQLAAGVLAVQLKETDVEVSADEFKPLAADGLLLQVGAGVVSVVLAAVESLPAASNATSV